MSLTTENKWRGLLLYTSFSGATDELPVHHVRLLIFTVVVMEKTGRLAGLSCQPARFVEKTTVSIVILLRFSSCCLERLYGTSLCACRYGKNEKNSDETGCFCKIMCADSPRAS